MLFFIRGFKDSLRVLVVGIFGQFAEKIGMNSPDPLYITEIAFIEYTVKIGS